MSPIRVLVLDMAVLDRDIVQRIGGGRSDMTIVGTVAGPEEAAGVIADVDVLVLSASEPEPLCEFLGLMWTHPGLGVVAVDRRGPLRVFRLGTRTGTAGLGWADDLVGAIHLAAGNGTGNESTS